MLPNVIDFWKIVLSQLALRIAPESVDWLRTNVIPLHINDTTLTLQVAKPFHKIWVEQTFLQDIETVVREMNGSPLAITLLTPTDTETAISTSTNAVEEDPSVPLTSVSSTSMFTEAERKKYLARLPEVPTKPIPLKSLPYSQTYRPSIHLRYLPCPSRRCRPVFRLIRNTLLIILLSVHRIEWPLPVLKRSLNLPHNNKIPFYLRQIGIRQNTLDARHL